jgi:hypothetical protein
VHLTGVEEMKEEALKLADELDALHQYVPSEAPDMIRRLVEELDKQKEKAKWFEESNKMFKETRDSLAMAVMLDQTSHDTTPQTKPLSDEEIINIWLPFATDGIKGKIEFARAIEKEHGIK